MTNNFAKYGLSDKIISDNASLFTASEFRKFCKAFTIKNITTLAYHLRNNDQSEGFVDTFKRTLKKSGENNTAIPVSVLDDIDQCSC